MEETGKFLWSSSLVSTPEWYPDCFINTCFSDVKRFGIMKKFFEAQMWRNFACQKVVLLSKTYND